MTGRLALCLLAVAAFSVLAACGDVGSVDEPMGQAEAGDPGKFDSPFFDEATLSVATGPYDVTDAEYRFQAEVMPDVLEDREIEIWAQVYHPVEMGDEPHPLLIFLHGNHGTCGTGSNPRIDNSAAYTYLGTCPPGYEVVPNHLGYGYIAEHMASWGYVVVSINANRGITAGRGVSGDYGLNIARGRLVLKHLELLAVWNTAEGSTPDSLGVDLFGTLDFGSIGLMGHSRGGEGVRAAYTLYGEEDSEWHNRIAEPLEIDGIFEIGPVDGQTSRTFDALDTAWAVLLPMCDGDVSDLQGMGPFDRMLVSEDEVNPTPKSMIAIWGTNHNFFNPSGKPMTRRDAPALATSASMECTKRLMPCG